MAIYLFILSIVMKIMQQNKILRKIGLYVFDRCWTHVLSFDFFVAQEINVLYRLIFIFFFILLLLQQGKIFIISAAPRKNRRRWSITTILSTLELKAHLNRNTFLISVLL